MNPKSVLFIGGTGVISSACVQRAVQANLEVTVLNRGRTKLRATPREVTLIKGDAMDPDALRAALGHREFDVVANFIVKAPEHALAEVDLFTDRTRQYIFISSATVYRKPVPEVPITESTPLGNPFSDYARNKLACEAVFTKAHAERDFPMTIVRPSSTYDRTRLPFEGGWTVVDRMRRGRPVVVHGDGTSLWVLTHQDDFARGFVPLLAHEATIGEAFHITSGEVLTWDAIYRIVAEAAGTEARLVHVASESIAAIVPDWGPRLLGDKAHSLIFDNSKVRALARGWDIKVPYSRGAREIVEWFDAAASRRVVNQRDDEAYEAILARYG